MINKELAKIFDSIANYLEIESVSFRSKAYRKASDVIEGLGEDISTIYNNDGLKGLIELEGIGKNIASKIEEYIARKRIKMYEDLKKSTPMKLEELISIEGLGVKRAKVLYKELGVKNLKDLERVAKKNKIAALEGFGEKSQTNILEGIEFVKSSNQRFPIAQVIPIVNSIIKKLKGLKEVKKIDVAGSFRRKKETIGDIDILVVSSKPEVVMDYFVGMKNVIKIWGHGKTKSSIRIKEGIDVDLRVIPVTSYGAAMQYFTGPKEHNIATRKIAISLGLKLNEYGLYKGEKMIAGKTEKEIYDKLGLKMPLPEIRETKLDLESMEKKR